MKVILINNLNHWNFISYFWTKIHNVYSLCSSCISKAAAAEIGGDAAFYVAKSSISWDGNNHTKRRYFFPFFSFLIFSPWESWLHPYAWSNYPFSGHYPLWQLGYHLINHPFSRMIWWPSLQTARKNLSVPLTTRKPHFLFFRFPLAQRA